MLSESYLEPCPHGCPALFFKIFLKNAYLKSAPSTLLVPFFQGCIYQFLSGQTRNAPDPDQLGINNYGWISALRFPQIRELHEAGSFEPELFDQMDLAEISNEELFPGERLVVCRNPFLAEERSRKREKLLKATEKKLDTIKHAVMREKNPYTGADRIGR